MDAETCVKKLSYIGVLYFATVDEHGAPQVRNISAIHYEPDALYFFTARGKEFCRQLLADGRVQISGYTMYKENIRLSGRAAPVPEEEQEKWIRTIFEEQPYLENVYPGDTKKIGIVFCIRGFSIEYFNLGVNPIFRETYTLGDVGVKEKGYTSRKPAWDATPARQYVRSGALRRARRTGFIGIIASVAGTAVRTVPRTRLSENEKKRLVVHITKK